VVAGVDVDVTVNGRGVVVTAAGTVLVVGAAAKAAGVNSGAAASTPPSRRTTDERRSQPTPMISTHVAVPSARLCTGTADR
jgi:hypothetical protein